MPLFLCAQTLGAIAALGIALDRETGLGDAGRVRERQVSLIVERLRGDDRNFAGSATRLISSLNLIEYL